MLDWRFVSFNELNAAQWAQLAAIETASHLRPWSGAQLQGCTAAGYLGTAALVAEQKEKGQANQGAPVQAVCGYSVFMPNVDDWELLNITVAPNHTGAGLGRQLLCQGLLAARAAHTSGVFLEVRPSNLAALALYHRTGFKPVGRRKDYYPSANPYQKEDALIMRLDF